MPTPQNVQTNSNSAIDHFVGLAFKGLSIVHSKSCKGLCRSNTGLENKLKENLRNIYIDVPKLNR